MANISIYINRQLADFENLDSFPFSLRKATDGLLSIATAEGTTIDNNIDSLVLPSTKNNLKIAGCPDNPNIERKKTLDQITVDVDGVQVFNGTGYLNNTSFNCDYSKALVYQLLGDGYSLWNRMDGVNLPSLDMGCVLRDLDSIVASFGQTYDDGVLGIFAPVIYGQTSGDSGQQTSGGDNTTECVIIATGSGINGVAVDLAEVRSISINGVVYELDTTWNSQSTLNWIDDVEAQLLQIITNNDDLEVDLISFQFNVTGAESFFYFDGANFTVDYISFYYEYNNFPLADSTFVGRGDVEYRQCKDNTAFAVSDFLFHVFHRSILDYLFTNLLCYTIDSKFLDSEWFKEQVYVASESGVEFEEIVYPIRVDAFSPSATYQNADNIVFNTENQDTFNELSGNIFTASDTQSYHFELDVTILDINLPNTLNPEKETLRIVGQITSPPNVDYIAFDIELPTPASIEFDLLMNAGDTITLGWAIYPIFQRDDNGDIQLCSIEANVGLNIRKTTDLCLNVSSLLHDRPVKEYLRGLFHKYNLAAFVDPVRCVTVIEPRFDYEINGEKCEGFYSRIKSYTTECLTCDNATIENVNPYGRSLTLGFCADDQDDLAKLIYEAGGNNVIYAGARFELNELGSGGRTNRNPYFCDLVQGQFDSINSSSLPAILQDYEQSEGLPEWNTVYDNPKTALIHRDLATIYIEGIGEVQAPLLAQYLSDNSPNGNPIYWDTMLSYSDVLTTDENGNTIRIKGLASTFYMQYAAIIREGKKLRGNFKKGTCEIQTENFRKVKKVEFGECNVSEWLLMEMNGINPLQGELIGQCLLKYRCVDVRDCYYLEHWSIDNGIEVSTTCDYTSEVGSMGAESITAIRWCDYKTLDLNYPYRTNSAVDAERLQKDLEDYLCSIGYEGQAVSVINQAGVWTIIFQASTLCALDIVTENQTTGEITYNNFDCYGVPVCDYCIVATFLDSVPRISSLILQDSTTVPLPSYPYLIPSQSQNFIDDLSAYYTANGLVFDSINVNYDGTNNSYEVKILASELKIAAILYGSPGQAVTVASAQETNCSGDAEFNCDLFLIGIDQVTDFVDCIYRIRFYHPTTGQEGFFALSIQDNDTEVLFDFDCVVTKNCGVEQGVVLKDELTIDYEQPFKVQVRGLLDIGDYISALRVYNSLTNTPIDVNIGIFSPYLSGAFGTVTPADITFNGSNHSTVVANIETVIKNALNALGFASNQYDIVTNASVVTDVFSISTYAKNNPTNAWIGIDKNDGYFTYFDSSLNVSNFSDEGVLDIERLIISESYNTPCGRIRRGYGAIDNVQYIDQAASNYDSIVINTNTLGNQPLHFTDANERTCTEQRTTLTATYSLCPEMPTFLWSTGETTQSIIVDSIGTYEVTVTCGLCVKTESITI